MRLLLDTHVAYWLAVEPGMLTSAEQRVLAAPDSDLAVSAISLWELRIKWSRRFVSGERKGPADPSDVLRILSDTTIIILGLPVEITVAALEPPLEHHDPFDELLLTHAQQTNRRLLTRDSKVSRHPAALMPA